MDVLKRLVELIPFFEPYPIWVKGLVCAWTFFTAALLLTLLFAPRRTVATKTYLVTGRVVSDTTERGVPAASVELSAGGVPHSVVSDSEGYFRFDLGRPNETTSGRIRVAAAGYLTYEKFVQLRTEQPDLGSFHIQPEQTAPAPSISLAEQLAQRRQQALEPPKTEIDRYSNLLRGGNAGTIKLLSSNAIDRYRPFLNIQGEGKYYSFTRRTHEYGYGSDIEFENGTLSTGFAGLDYGYFLNLGTIPIEQIAVATAEPPTWLPAEKREAWAYMWSYRPPNMTANVRREQKEARSKTISGVSVAERAAAVEGNSYLLRSIIFDRADLLVGLRVESFTEDGSVIIIWKILRTFDTPVASGPEPQP